MEIWRMDSWAKLDDTGFPRVEEWPTKKGTLWHEEAEAEAEAGKQRGVWMTPYRAAPSALSNDQAGQFLQRGPGQRQSSSFRTAWPTAGGHDCIHNLQQRSHDGRAPTTIRTAAICFKELRFYRLRSRHRGFGTDAPSPRAPKPLLSSFSSDSPLPFLFIFAVVVWQKVKFAFFFRLADMFEAWVLPRSWDSLPR